MSNNKQQTAVEWYAGRQHDLEGLRDVGAISPIEYYEQLTQALQQAKEMQKEQSQAYAAFCVGCDRKKLPLLEFEGWIKLGDEQ
jgi:1,4-dihydroxy-2-naphthoyl-CoA synthase